MLEMLKLGFTVAGIGIGVVFGILLILILCIKLVGFAMTARDRHPKEEAKQVAEPQVVAISNTSNAQLVAVITAAVSAMLEEGDNRERVSAPFVIRQIKEIRR